MNGAAVHAYANTPSGNTTNYWHGRMDCARGRLKVRKAKSINLQFKQERVKRAGCVRKLGERRKYSDWKSAQQLAACMLNDLCAPLGVAVGCNNSWRRRLEGEGGDHVSPSQRVSPPLYVVQPDDSVRPLFIVPVMRPFSFITHMHTHTI